MPRTLTCTISSAGGWWSAKCAITRYSSALSVVLTGTQINPVIRISSHRIGRSMGGNAAEREHREDDEQRDREDEHRGAALPAGREDAPEEASLVGLADVGLIGAGYVRLGLDEGHRRRLGDEGGARCVWSRTATICRKGGAGVDQC